MSPGALILRLARSKWCAAFLTRLLTVLLTMQQACRQLCACIYSAPLVACVIASAVLVLASLILLFNICLARLFTIPGAILLNAGLLWCLLRLAVRAIAFPGSIVLWKRSTEAMWRVEMAKQWTYQLEQLLAFLRAATGRTQGATPGASLEGAVTGCALVEGLARNLRAQQRDKVHFTQEQARMRLLVTGVEAWLNEAKVSDRRGGKAESQVPLVDWLQRMSQSIVPLPMNYAVASAPLVRESQAEAGTCIDRLEQLTVLFDGLHRQEDGCCASARRFLRVPTVGSLHQMRAELLVRYSGNHCWVRTPDGRKIDGMFIAAHGSEGSGLSAEISPKEDALVGSNNKEDVPLKEVVAESSNTANPGAVVVWCNPNAGYYETMAYESHWLDFYLSQGCSVFLFNYGGFGRSQGNTTTSTVAADGNAVVEFLKRRGFTEIGVHGRSIGGIAACNIAQAHPDTIKFLCADRTFSSLARVAKFGFGEWAVKALGLSATWADNLGPYLQARCYKVLICDPKDATVPDIASLRTGVAMDTILQVPPADRLAFGEDKIQRLAEAWAFFDTLIAIIDRDEPALDGIACTMSCCQAKRPARQPIVGKPQVESDARAEFDEEDTQRLVGTWPHGEVRGSAVDVRWLEEHGEVVQSVMTRHIEALRLALEVVGSQLNAGTSLEDTLSRGGPEAREALRCFLANIQVWGSLNPSREPLSPSTMNGDAEFFLSRRSDQPETQEVLARLSRVLASLTPDRLAVHQRQTSRSLVAHVRRLFRQHLSALRRSLEPLARDDGTPASALCAAVLVRLREIEGFMTSLYRFFKCVDVAGVPPLLPAGVPQPPCEIIPGVPAEVATSDDSEESRDPTNSRALRPTLDRSVTGYLLCIDCGHNGVLSETELRHLSLHLRAARFGGQGGDMDLGV